MLQHLRSSSVRSISTRIDIFIRNYATSRVKRRMEVKKKPIEDIKLEDKVYPNFMARFVGLSNWKWTSAFEKHPELSSLNQHCVLSSVKILKKLNFSLEDICLKPTVLLISASTIENRYYVLEECGVHPISLAKLLRYITIMNKSVADLKTQQYIPNDVDVVEKLCSTFTDEIGMRVREKVECNENMDLKELRQIILNEYLRQRLGMTDMDLVKLWKSYSRVRNKCFRFVQSIIELLINDLKFSKDRIVKNTFLLYADPDNVRRILDEIPTIGGQNIRDIGYRRPKILMSNCDALLKTLHHVKSFGINEEAVTRCLEMLTLGPDTVLERLNDLNEVEEFRVLSTNPRVLRLVHYQNKARLRLEYLNQLRMRCASLHILSCGSEAFARFARDGSDRTKGRDSIVYLSKVMNKNENDVRNLMSRHPNWCHIPAIHVKQVYEFLLNKKFSTADIYQNIHILLYPIKRIDQKLQLLHGSPENLGLCDRDVYNLSNTELLTLVLYLIECEFHFTGDGIWTDQHTQHVENFSNLLPDFPEAQNKVYKYGLKPSSNPKPEL